MTDIHFLSAIKNDESVRRQIVQLIVPHLFAYISSPVRFEPADIQTAFHSDVEEALFGFHNALDCLVYLRSKGWEHDPTIHQAMENGYRKIQDALELVCAEECQAIGYAGPVSVPSVVSISGAEYVAVQVDELVPEGCFMAAPVKNGRLVRDGDGTLQPSKKSWLRIDDVLRPFDDQEGIEDFKRDFEKYWRKDLGEGLYHREYLVHLLRNIG